LAQNSHRTQLERYFTLSAIPKTVLFAPDGKLIDVYEGNSDRLSYLLDSIFKR
jgi:hypothetical protein